MGSFVRRDRPNLKRFFPLLLAIISLVNMAVAGPSDDAYKEAKSLMEKGDLQEAVEVAVSALSTDPEHFKLNRITGKLYFELEQYQEALDFFTRALMKKKKDSEALFGGGMSAFRLGDYEQAEALFERGVKTKKIKGEFLYGLGITQMEMGNYSKADVNLRKAVDKDDKVAKYHMALGEENYRNKVYSIAISQFYKAIELDSTLEMSVPDLHFKLAQAYLNMRNVPEAIEEYRRDLELFPRDTVAWLELGRIFEASHNPADAAFCHEKYLEIVPDNGEIWFKLGNIYRRPDVDNKEKATEAFEKAASLGSHVAESFGFLAKLYADQNELENSISAYNRYEEVFGPPDSVLYWYEKGRVGIKLGVKNTAYFDTSLMAFQKAIEIDSTFSQAYEYAGLAMYYKRSYDKAIPYFLKKIELDSSSVNSLRNLAFCYLKTESYNHAASTFEKALILKPEDITMRAMLGKIYTFNKKYEKSVMHYEHIIDNQSDLLTDSLRCVIYPDLGLSYLSLMRCQEAIPVLLKAEKCRPGDPAVRLNIASSYQTCNMMKKANAYYKKVLEIDPANPDARKGEMQTRFQGQE